METCQNSVGAKYLTISMAVISWGFWSLWGGLIKRVPAGSHVSDKSNIFQKCAYWGAFYLQLFLIPFVSQIL